MTIKQFAQAIGVNETTAKAALLQVGAFEDSKFSDIRKEDFFETQIPVGGFEFAATRVIVKALNHSTRASAD